MKQIICKSTSGYIIRFLATSEGIVQRGSVRIYSNMVGALVIDLGRKSKQKLNRKWLGDDKSAAYRAKKIYEVRHIDQGLQQHRRWTN